MCAPIGDDDNMAHAAKRLLAENPHACDVILALAVALLRGGSDAAQVDESFARAAACAPLRPQRVGAAASYAKKVLGVGDAWSTDLRRGAIRVDGSVPLMIRPSRDHQRHWTKHARTREVQRFSRFFRA